MLSVSFPTVFNRNSRKFIPNQGSTPKFNSSATDLFQSRKQVGNAIRFSGVFGPLLITPTDEELENIEQQLPAAQGRINSDAKQLAHHSWPTESRVFRSE